MPQRSHATARGMPPSQRLARSHSLPLATHVLHVHESRARPSAAQREAPLFLAYNSDREEQLLKAFEEYPGPPLERKFGLTYRSVRDDTQSKIALYGPKGPIPC